MIITECSNTGFVAQMNFGCGGSSSGGSSNNNGKKGDSKNGGGKPSVKDWTTIGGWR